MEHLGKHTEKYGNDEQLWKTRVWNIHILQKRVADDYKHMLLDRKERSLGLKAGRKLDHGRPCMKMYSFHILRYVFERAWASGKHSS